MASKRTRWLVALVAALTLVVAACEADEEEDVTDPDDDVEEPADEPDPDEEEDDEVGVEDDDEAVEEDEEEEEDLTPADGETVLDALTARAEDVDAPEPGEEEAEAEEAEEEEAPVDEDPTFVTLVEAVEIAGLEELLGSEGPFTVFAPTDDAFALYPEDSFEELVDDPERLEDVLAYHVVEGEHTSDDLDADDELDTISGETLTVRESEAGDLLIEGAPLVETDIEADNGVVHAIGSVLLAPAE